MDLLLAALSVDDEDDTLDSAAATVARQIKEFARRACFVDLVALEDGLLYRMAIGKVGRRVEAPEVPLDPATWRRLVSEPDHAYPLAIAPFESVAVWTPLSRLLAGDLAPGPHPGTVHLVVAKLVARSAPSFFTRQSATVETFTVGRLASLLLPLCDGRRSLRSIAQDLAARTDQRTPHVLRRCASAVVAFGKAGVLDLRQEPESTQDTSATD
jgi:hypothetical protein